MSRVSELLQRTFGIGEIMERLKRIERSMRSDQILEGLRRIDEAPQRSEHIERTQSDSNTLEILPGTPYSRYAIPVEYPPSRSFAARWGYSHGRIEALAQWFAAHNEDYQEFLGFLGRLDLSHIPISLSPAEPLAPAWVGGPITAFDCLALYGIIHKYSPKLYLEIGSGMTTCFARRAIADRATQHESCLY